jgi:hypothetical protein
MTDGTPALTAAADEIRRAVRAEQITTLLCNVEDTRRAALELTIHDLDPAFCAAVERASDRDDPGGVRAALRFEAMFPGFRVDDRAFQPPAYSLNALLGPHYCALHVRLDGRRPWLSIDTSWSGPGASIDVAARLRDAVRAGRRPVERLY